MKVSKSEFARKMGVSPQRVSQWLAEGVIKADENGKIDYQKAKKAVEANLDPLRRQAWEARGEGSLAEERRRKLQIERRLKELEYLIATRELIPRREVIQEFVKRIYAVKSGLLSLSKTLPPKLLGKDVREMAQEIRHQIYLLLKTYSDPKGIEGFSPNPEKFREKISSLIERG